MAGRRILFNIVPGSGHLNPTVPLALALQARGHDVRVGTAASYAPQVRAAGLQHVAVGRDWDGGDVTASNPDFLQLAVPEQLRWVVGMTATTTADSLVELAQGWRPDLIVRDSISVGAWVAGEELGIPVVLFGITGVMPLPVAQMILGDALAELRAHRGLAPDPDLTGLTGVIALDTTPPSMLDAFAGMIQDRQPLRPTQWTGDTTDAAPDWFATLGDRPVVYATLGTVVNRNPEVFRKVIAAAAGMDIDMVMTIGRNGDLASLGELPSNVHVAPYIAQDVVLAKASAVICHAGRGTTYGALEAGLPLTLVPLGTDQPLVAAACERAGAGVICATTTVAIGPMQLAVARPEDLDVDQLRAAMERTLTDAGLRGRATDLAGEIAAMPSPADGALMVEEAAGALATA
ncbi:MAG: glycosyltransferase [Candidatus Dormibacteria bacterium]